MSGSSNLNLELEAVLTGKAGGRTLRVTLRLTNTGDTPLMPGIFGSELLVDGQPDPSWRLALNGAMEPELVELPPGKSAELCRELRVAALTPGPHEVVVRLGEQSTAAVRVDVM